MGFSNQEAINLNFAALAAGVIDANSSAVWFEKQFGFSFILDANSVWTQLSSIPAAGNLTTARNNAVANPTIISDLSANADAVRLTKIAGTNNSTFAAYSTYNDTTSAIHKNWILPQLIPQSSGAASNGYAVNLYNGDPNAGGTLITTTDGQTGTGSTKQVGWIYNYALGLLLVSDDFYARTGINSATFNPYIVGFLYIGNTANTGTASAERTSSAVVADEAIVAGAILRMSLNGEVGMTAGRVVNANAATEADAEVVGIAVTAAGAQGNSLTMATGGEASVLFGSTPASTDNGKQVYLSTTDGKATLTVPSSNGQTVFKIGKLKGGNGSDATPAVALNLQYVVLIG